MKIKGEIAMGHASINCPKKVSLKIGCIQSIPIQRLTDTSQITKLVMLDLLKKPPFFDKYLLYNRPAKKYNKISPAKELIHWVKSQILTKLTSAQTNIFIQLNGGFFDASLLMLRKEAF